MSRPLRFQAAGLAYHVMSRGNDKRPIFLDDLDYARFIELVAEVRDKFGLDSWLFCVMPNHYHLVFRTSQPNLSAAVHYLNASYAQWWNKRHRHVGHVYQSRFKAQVVECSVYLLRLCRYVLVNPVRAGLVPHPADWRWSSYGALAGTRAACVDIPSLLGAIAPDAPSEIRARLLEFVDGYVDEEIATFLRKDRRVIGGARFAVQFRRQAGKASSQVPRRERLIGTPSLASLLADAVHRGDGIAGGIRDAHRSLYSIEEIAFCAGLSANVVSKMVRRNHFTVPRRGTLQDLPPDLAPGDGICRPDPEDGSQVPLRRRSRKYLT